MQMRINFSESSTSVNVLNSYTATADPHYGYNQINLLNGKYQSFKAYVNAGNPNISQNNIARSAACHELGHAMSLADSDVPDSLMDLNRNRAVVYRPTQDDLDGVNNQYY